MPAITTQSAQIACLCHSGKATTSIPSNVVSTADAILPTKNAAPESTKHQK